MTTQSPQGTSLGHHPAGAQASDGGEGRILPRSPESVHCSDLLEEFLGAMDRIESEIRDGFMRRCGLATSPTVWP